MILELYWGYVRVLGGFCWGFIRVILFLDLTMIASDVPV